MGWVGSGLGLTWTQPDWVRLQKMWPAIDPIYKLDPTVQVIGWMGWIWQLGGFRLWIGPNFVNLHDFFFLLNFWQAFWAQINGLTFNKDLYIFEPCIYIYISYGPFFTSFISNWAFKLSLYAITQLWIFWVSRPYQYKFNISSSHLMTKNIVNIVNNT